MTDKHDAVKHAGTQEVFEVLLRIAKALEGIQSTLDSVVGDRQDPHGPKKWRVLMTETKTR